MENGCDRGGLEVDRIIPTLTEFRFQEFPGRVKKRRANLTDQNVVGRDAEAWPKKDANATSRVPRLNLDITRMEQRPLPVHRKEPNRRTEVLSVKPSECSRKKKRSQTFDRLGIGASGA